MNSHYPFINTPLPYAYNGLEPYIDEKTMMLHHDRHLQTYIDNLNSALREHTQFHSWSLEQLIFYASSLPEAIRTQVKNNAGGVYNHRFFFEGMTDHSSAVPEGTLKEALNRQFGSFGDFKQKFKEAAMSVFGSGYAWLAVDGTGALRILTSADQDTLLALGMCPVLNLDVWEHAYYLKHYNMRAGYVDDWFPVVNWRKAEERYFQCLNETK